MNLFGKCAGLFAAAILLDGCTSLNLFKDTPSADATAPAVQSQPIPAPMAPTGQGLPGAVSSAQIKALLTGKSWRWKGPNNGGITLYAADGTSLVEVTGKGTTQGRWEARDGQLCESYAPAAFLPQGLPMTCQAFTGGNGLYKVGPATFQLAS